MKMLKFASVLQYFLIVLLCCPSSKAKQARNEECNDKQRTNSFLWSIKRQPPAYFFGTIHVPYTKVWSHIPQASMDAFSQSDQVYFELDLTDAQTLSALIRCQLLPHGTDLREVLPSDLYRRLKQHLDYVKSAIPAWITSEQRGKGMYAETLYEAIVGNWERKRPVWVMLMINSLTEADVRSRGIPVLDLHLARKAERMGKIVGAVEKVDEQCKPLNGMNMPQVIFALNHTLMVQEKLRRGKLEVSYTTDDLIKQYNCGDIEAITVDQDSVQVPKMTNHSSKLNDPAAKNSDGQDMMAEDIDSYFKNELIYHRNERMAKRVNGLLKENPDQSFFFAFGAGHFLGNGSVIDFLKRYGYEIENVRSYFPHRRKQKENTSKSNKRRRRKERNNNNRKRKKALRNNNSRKKRRKRKQRIRNRWKPSRHKSSYNTISTKELLQNSLIEDGFNLLDESQIRVINRYPTVFPPNVYGKWTIRGHKRKNSELPLYLHSKSHGHKQTSGISRKVSSNLSDTDKSNLGNPLYSSGLNVDPFNGAKSFAQNSLSRTFLYIAALLINYMFKSPLF